MDRPDHRAGEGPDSLMNAMACREEELTARKQLEYTAQTVQRTGEYRCPGADQVQLTPVGAGPGKAEAGVL